MGINTLTEALMARYLGKTAPSAGVAKTSAMDGMPKTANGVGAKKNDSQGSKKPKDESFFAFKKRMANERAEAAGAAKGDDGKKKSVAKDGLDANAEKPVVRTPSDFAVGERVRVSPYIKCKEHGRYAVVIDKKDVPAEYVAQVESICDPNDLVWIRLDVKDISDFGLGESFWGTQASTLCKKSDKDFGNDPRASMFRTVADFVQGERVRVRPHIRCFQTGHYGTVMGLGSVPDAYVAGVGVEGCQKNVFVLLDATENKGESYWCALPSTFLKKGDPEFGEDPKDVAAGGGNKADGATGGIAIIVTAETPEDEKVANAIIKGIEQSAAEAYMALLAEDKAKQDAAIAAAQASVIAAEAEVGSSEGSGNGAEGDGDGTGGASTTPSADFTPTEACALIEKFAKSNPAFSITGEIVVEDVNCDGKDAYSLLFSPDSPRDIDAATAYIDDCEDFLDKNSADVLDSIAMGAADGAALGGFNIRIVIAKRRLVTSPFGDDTGDGEGGDLDDMIHVTNILWTCQPNNVDVSNLPSDVDVVVPAAVTDLDLFLKGYLEDRYGYTPFKYVIDVDGGTEVSPYMRTKV